MSSIWSKESAKCSQVIDISSDLQSIEDKLNETIDCHYFSHNLQLISTNSDLISIIEDYIQSTNTLSYYLVKRTPIHVFINQILINGFVKKGKLFCLSIDKEIDFDNSFAVLPKGLIVLSVKESTYHRLGIVGKKSILYKNKNCVKKYLIEIDLNNEHLIPGTKHYTRTEECLQRSGLIFDVFIKWEPNEELLTQSISSMSIKNFFSYIKTNSSDNSLQSIQWFRCSPSLRKFVNTFVAIPCVDKQYVDQDIQSMIEWLGAQVCQIECDPSEDTDVSTFGVTDSDRRHDISCVVLNGFFNSFDVKRLLSELKEKVMKIGLNAVIVNGFEDTPIGWKGKNNEHSKNTSGENMYGMASDCGQGLAFVYRIADEFDYGIEKL